MGNKMSNKIAVIAVCLAMILLTGAASADVFHLTNTNTPQLAGIDIQVTTDGTNKIISVQLVNNPPSLINTPVGIDKFYYNIADNSIANEDDPIGNWRMLRNPPVRSANFGLFDEGAQNTGGTGGIASPITFTLTDQFTTIPTNDRNAKFAVHIRYSDDCSGFVSDGTATSIESTSNCKQDTYIPSNQDTQIPEFPTVALPLAAVIVLMFLFQYRKRKEE